MLIHSTDYCDKITLSSLGGFIKILAKNADFSYFPEFIPHALRKSYFTQLMTEINWQQEQLSMYGKLINIPRLQAWYGLFEYSYSGLTLKPQPLTPLLAELKALIEQKSGQSFNAILANCYRDQNDTVGWHSDDEPELGINPVIASLSLGEERNFQLKHKETGEKLVFPLKPGSLFIMSGQSQHYWQHCLPRTQKRKSARINLTFRYIHSL